jgi:tetratricopeptide (TPR) repeat protein
MQKSITFGILGLVIGLIIGFFAANNINRNSAQTASTVQTNIQPQQNPQVPNVLVKEQPTTQNTRMLPDVSAMIDKANNEPANFEAQIKAGDLYQQIKGFDKAIAFYERAHQLKPDDYDLIVKLGNTRFDARQFEAAADWYERALKIKPNDTNVRTDLGITFVERANPDYDRAVKEFDASLKLNPKHEPTLYNLGAAYSKQGNKEEANKILSRLEAVNPNSQLVSRLRQVINS